MTAEPLVPLELGQGPHTALLAEWLPPQLLHACRCAACCIPLPAVLRLRDVVAEYLTEGAAAWP